MLPARGFKMVAGNKRHRLFAGFWAYFGAETGATGCIAVTVAGNAKVLPENVKLTCKTQLFSAKQQPLGVRVVLLLMRGERAGAHIWHVLRVL